MIELTNAQNTIIRLPLEQSIFLTGNPGCGKTTSAIQRINYLLESGVRDSSILILTPSRTFSEPYRTHFAETGQKPMMSTHNAFSQRAIELFFPLIAEKAGFNASEPCQFLTIETAQILLAKQITPLVEEGHFNVLQTPISRIYNQILIALNKMAAAELPFNDYAKIMKSSWTGDKVMLPLFDIVQTCGENLLSFCRSHNFLNFSLQIETFQQHLLPDRQFQQWLKNMYPHLIYDNLEEDTPAAHHFAETLLQTTQSALLIADHLGGIRNFMSADPQSAIQTGALCQTQVELSESFICSPDVCAMAEVIAQPHLTNAELSGNPRNAYHFNTDHQYPMMIKRAAIDTAELIHRYHVPPEEIVIIAPLISDVLYTALERELRMQNISCYISKPSRALIEEPESKSVLTLLALLHPEWDMHPRMLDICQMIEQFIPSIDSIRAQLYVGQSFVNAEVTEGYDIRTPDQLKPQIKERFSDEMITHLTTLCQWIQENRSTLEDPDITLSKFFHEILVQDGFVATSPYAQTFNTGIKKVSDSLQKFRSSVLISEEKIVTWSDYLKLIQEGMVSAQYLEDIFQQPPNTILITLASAFVTMNKPASIQIWLNAGSPRWWEKSFGLLTNDYVLSKNWIPSEVWDAKSAIDKNNESMVRQVLSLLAHCKKQINVYTSELNESGQDQKSQLLYLFSELAYRFGEKPTSFNEKTQLPTDAESSPIPFYPGISDSDPNQIAEERVSDYFSTNELLDEERE